VSEKQFAERLRLERAKNWCRSKDRFKNYRELLPRAGGKTERKFPADIAGRGRRQKTAQLARHNQGAALGIGLYFPLKQKANGFSGEGLLECCAPIFAISFPPK